MPDEDIFDNQPLEDDLDDAVEFELIDDDPETSTTDEEMSDELEGDAGDSQLAPDDEEDDSDDEEADDRSELEELRAEKRRRDYETQQRNNQEYWDGIEGQARDAFEWEYEQIFVQKDNYYDPDAFVREQTRQLNHRIRDWYGRFYASQNEVRRQQYEKAAIPTYAARVATHFGLNQEQARSLLDYAPQDFQREAQKMSRANAREESLRKQLRQSRRKDARGKIVRQGVQPGGGRTPAVKVRKGSQNHLKLLLSGAA